MLVFPERLLAGDIPNKDFLHLYGPGSLWALAAWYKVVGVSLAAERVFGTAQLAGIVFGVVALARPWGRKVAAAAGVVGVLLTTTAIGLTALAWDGAVALALAALWVGLRARRWLTDAPGVDPEVADRRANRLLVVSGVLAGAALLFRPDVVIAVGIGTTAALAGLGRDRWKRWLTGAVPTVALFLVHVALAGPGNVIEGMLLEPVFDLRAGRSLPRPPSPYHFDGALQKVSLLRPPAWSLPALSSPRQAWLWFFLLPVASLFVVAVGWWRVRAEPEVWRHRVLLATGLLGLGLLPQAFQRADTTHLAWVSCVTLAFLPAAIAEVLGRLPSREVRRYATATAAVLALAVPLFVVPHFTARNYLDLVQQTGKDDVFGFPVHHDGRTFYLGAREIAPAAQELVDALGDEATPGQRLFVGTADLRKTPYSDAYLYFLLPDLVPATRYIEMDPGMANAEDSGLADEVAGSDWLILSHVWDAWVEPNTSRDFGSDEPNQVVERDFCLVDTFGPAAVEGQPEPTPYFLLYRRCT